MRYSPHLLDEIRARLPVSQVVGRRVALKKAGREYRGLSPFKVEKSPSFFVNDQKGFYHCFASGEHGDIFTFLIKTEGLTFPEAVERLAGEAGVALPKPTAEDAAQYDQRQRLLEVLAASAKFYAEQLHSSGGTAARRYIEKRGLSRASIETFGLGFAPASRTALKDHLAAKGFNADEAALSGMLISGEDIREPYDRFRDRVMFPIADHKGRIIAFGGRALDPDAPAKYLNSPETPLFHKGHTLFNSHRARSAAHDKGRIVAVEGYMDVVAMAEAGFTEAVAPLGTALTEDQMALLWRMADEPILCFDGDSAGRKAAWRAIDVALPKLKPGASVRFAFLPDGLDPDDLVRQQGPQAMEAALTAARPLSDVLFEREWSQDEWTTPERRAKLEQQINALVAKIEDGAVRGHYAQDMRRRLAAAWAPKAATRSDRANGQSQGNARYGQRPGFDQDRRFAGQRPGYGARPDQLRGYAQGGRRGQEFANFQPPLPTPSLIQSGLVAGDRVTAGSRELLLLRTVVNHPWLLETHAEEFAGLNLASPALSRLRDGLLSALALDNSLDTPTLRSQLTRMGLAGVLDHVDAAIPHRCDRFADPETGRSEVESGWRHALALHDRQVGLPAALASAEQAWHEDGTEDAFQRIRELQAERQRLTNTDDSETDVLDAL